ncbi:MAG: cysteine hydrolase [Chloroflexia bacterium]|nr:cysteine hydrolase [Chloroflexia bacterium]
MNGDTLEVVSEFSERRTGRRLRFDPDRAAILVVDMLNEFLEPEGVMPLLEGRRIIAPLNALLAEGRRLGMRVIWLCDEHPHREDREFEKRIPHCFAGTWNAGIIDAMDVAPDEPRIAKRRYSGFFGTDLDLRLREWGVQQVVVTGVVTNICVRSTVHDAYFLGYDVFVPEDCVSATSDREQVSTLYDIDTHFGDVVTSGELLAGHVTAAATAGV